MDIEYLDYIPQEEGSPFDNSYLDEEANELQRLIDKKRKLNALKRQRENVRIKPKMRHIAKVPRDLQSITIHGR